MAGGAGEDIGEPGLWGDAVHFRGAALRDQPQNSQDFRPRAMPRKPRSAIASLKQVVW
jgi:hypothetical protein